jgi:hypothetical protein
MIRLLPFAVIVAVYVYSFIDLATSPGNQVRVMPRPVWLLVMLVVPVVGVVAWFIFGRPVAQHRGGGGGGLNLRRPRPSSGPTGPSRGPVAPDDDPDFLHKLDELRRKSGEDPNPGS